MITEDQTEVVAFLESASTHGGKPVVRIDTHASIVFLAGDRAWKLKRAVRYDYLDFSTVERRRAMCEAEIRVNRRVAPGLYRRAIPVTREADGCLALGGRGIPVEWLVEMVRFDQEGLLDRLAARNALDLALMCPLATTLARFHDAAPRRADHGGKAGMTWVIEGNAAGFAEFGSDVLHAALCSDLTRRSRAAVDRCGSLLDWRRNRGFVRQCHGDLHLRNIVLIDGTPTLFDAIEFNDEIACIDVFYDLAFLLMDCWHRGLMAHANRLLNVYLAETEDYDGMAVLALFLACRAAVNAKTRVTAAALQHGADDRRQLQMAAREYLELAARLIAPVPPRLIAIGGLSGSGKSTLAMGVAPVIGRAPGAVVLRSDELRKRLFHLNPLVRLGAAAYTPEVSHAIYELLAKRAALILQHGHSVIVDAVFADAGNRRAIETVAATAGVPFDGLWLEAPPTVLIARTARRNSDASDADARVVEAQVRYATRSIGWTRVDGSAPSDRVLCTAREILDPLTAGVLSGAGAGQ